MPASDIVRACRAAYLAQDRSAAQRLIAEDFVFTSPQDDRIDRSAFLVRCFPTADRFRANDLLYLVDVDDTNVLMVYEYGLHDGERYRNAELNTVRDGQLVETQVFFGGRLSAGQEPGRQR